MRQNASARFTAWTRDRALTLDVTGAAVLTSLAVLLSSQVGAGAVLVSAVLCGGLAVRRARPEVSGAVVAGAGLAQLALSPVPLFADVAVLCSLYALAAYARPWASRAGFGLGLLGAFLAALRYYWPAGGVVTALVVWVFVLVLVVAAWALGNLRRVSHQNELALRERARLLEVERENESRLAATAERQRIAREVHDVVAHSLSVVVAQADGGRYAAARDPAAASAALETIAATARRALGDMRGLLGVLREGPGDERAPQPDARAVPDLVAGVRASGLDVVLDVVGEPREQPAATGLAAYRIVQEALTNVLKHAGPGARARVEVRWDADALRLGVDDDGRGAGAVPAGGAGQGLLGMRERARLHGGAVLTGPRPGGGFSVRATLPHEGPGSR